MFLYRLRRRRTCFCIIFLFLLFQLVFRTKIKKEMSKKQRIELFSFRDVGMQFDKSFIICTHTHIDRTYNVRFPVFVVKQKKIFISFIAFV